MCRTVIGWTVVGVARHRSARARARVRACVVCDRCVWRGSLAGGRPRTLWTVLPTTPLARVPSLSLSVVLAALMRERARAPVCLRARVFWVWLGVCVYVTSPIFFSPPPAAPINGCRIVDGRYIRPGCRPPRPSTTVCNAPARRHPEPITRNRRPWDRVGAPPVHATAHSRRAPGRHVALTRARSLSLACALPRLFARSLWLSLSPLPRAIARAHCRPRYRALSRAVGIAPRRYRTIALSAAHAVRTRPLYTRPLYTTDISDRYV